MGYSKSKLWTTPVKSSSWKNYLSFPEFDQKIHLIQLIRQKIQIKKDFFAIWAPNLQINCQAY